MLGTCTTMDVVMYHLVGDDMEWPPVAIRLASLRRLLYCCTCCTVVLVHQVQQICCTSTAVQPPHLGQRLLYAVLAVLLYLLYCCTCCTAVLPGLRVVPLRLSKRSLDAFQHAHGRHGRVGVLVGSANVAWHAVFLGVAHTS